MNRQHWIGYGQEQDGPVPTCTSGICALMLPAHVAPQNRLSITSSTSVPLFPHLLIWTKLWLSELAAATLWNCVAVLWERRSGSTWLHFWAERLTNLSCPSESLKAHKHLVHLWYMYVHRTPAWIVEVIIPHKIGLHEAERVHGGEKIPDSLTMSSSILRRYEYHVHASLPEGEVDIFQFASNEILEKTVNTDLQSVQIFVSGLSLLMIPESSSWHSFSHSAANKINCGIKICQRACQLMDEFRHHDWLSC